MLMIVHLGRDVLGYCPQVVWAMSLGGLMQNAYFLYLFSMMYRNTYLRKKQPKSAE